MGDRFTRAGLAQVRYVRPVLPAAADGLVARVYEQMVRDFGMVAPPIALHSPAPDVLAASWSALRETLVATHQVERATKEAVAAAVSLANACPYCVGVHGGTLYGLARGKDAIAVAEDRIDAVADPRLRAVAAWARTSGRPGGAASAAPFPAGHTAEIVGTAVFFQYLNRMVNVFLGDTPLPPAVPAALRGRIMRVVGRLLRPTASGNRPPGDSLDLLPAATLPDDLAWAAGNPAVAGAFARAAAVVEAAGRRSVPAPVRDLVLAELAEWDGRPAGLGRAWVTTAVSGLPTEHRPAGVLALLTAKASYQVDESVVGDFRGRRHGDAALVELTAWASLAAARQVGSRMATPAPEGTGPGSAGRQTRQRNV